MVVGGYGSGGYNKIVENFSSQKWNVLDNFPFADSYIYGYSTVTFNDDMLIFGKFIFHFL